MIHSCHLSCLCSVLVPKSTCILNVALCLKWAASVKSGEQSLCLSLPFWCFSPIILKWQKIGREVDRQINR